MYFKEVRTKGKMRRLGREIFVNFDCLLKSHVSDYPFFPLQLLSQQLVETGLIPTANTASLVHKFLLSEHAHANKGHVSVAVSKMCLSIFFFSNIYI